MKAGISNYSTDQSSRDYLTRALVFGDESARISGQVVVNQDGSKTFNNIEIKPFDTDFDFKRNTWNPFIEIPRAAADVYYDPFRQGIKYDIKYRGHGRLDDPFSGQGIGRIYRPFTDSQLQAAMRRPGDAPPGLLPSFTAAPPPALEEHLQYLKQQNGTNPQAPDSVASASTFVSPAPLNSSGSRIGDWMAPLAGVDPANPNQPEQSGISGRPTNPPISQRIPFFFGMP